MELLYKYSSLTQQMMTSQLEKNNLYETNFTYTPLKDTNQLNSSRTIYNLDKENVVPCTAQLQSFISTLNQKKYQLKNLIVQRQKLNELSAEQQTKLSTETIRQNFEVQREEDLHTSNIRTLDEIESMKKEKLKNMEKMVVLKKSLEQRLDQIVEMKKLVADLQQQNSTLEEQIKQMNKENQALSNQNNQLDLMSQNLDNEVLHTKQTVRESEVRLATTQKALNMFKNRIQQTLNSIKDQNKETRRIVQTINEVNDKIKKLRQQKSEYDINSNELVIRNEHIQDTNMKLRNDLEKCKGHLMCVLKNNEVLSNSIEEFTYVDERVTKIIRKNQLKKL